MTRILIALLLTLLVCGHLIAGCGGMSDTQHTGDAAQQGTEGPPAPPQGW